LEADSTRLGIKGEPVKFHDLEKINKKRKNSTNLDNDTNCAMLPHNPNTTMMLNTNRNEGLETQQYLPFQANTRIVRRNSLLAENSLDILNRNLVDADLDGAVSADLNPSRVNTENYSENDRRVNENSTRLQITTDLGITSRHQQIAHPSPVNETVAGEMTMSDSRRNAEGHSSRMSMNTNAITETRVRVSINPFRK